MDTARLRRLVGGEIYSLGLMRTHSDIPGLCEALGIPTPEEGTKKDRMARCVDALDEAALPDIAKRLLSDFPLRAELRNQLEDLLWSGHGFPPILKRVRREVALALSPDDLYLNGSHFDALLERLWVVEEDPFDALAFLAAGTRPKSLKAQIEKHVHQNPGDWTTDQFFEVLGVYEASDRRFALFLEGLASSNVRPDEAEQRRFVAIVNEPLKGAGVELHETGNEDGYPKFEVVPIHAGRRARPKNLIFASSNKPDLRFRDAIDNDVEIVSNAADVLIYDRPIGKDGLTWADLQAWWSEREKVTDANQAKKDLYQRLKRALPSNSPPQLAVFDGFYQGYGRAVPILPALLPEVWLHWDPQTVSERGKDALLRFRMDFLLLLPHGVRVIVEVDGKHHYAKANGSADPERYAQMMRADREMRLTGYDLYRFGASELLSPSAKGYVKEFFDALFKRHGVSVNP